MIDKRKLRELSVLQAQQFAKEHVLQFHFKTGRSDDYLEALKDLEQIHFKKLCLLDELGLLKAETTLNYTLSSR